MYLTFKYDIYKYKIHLNTHCNQSLKHSQTQQSRIAPVRNYRNDEAKKHSDTIGKAEH